MAAADISVLPSIFLETQGLVISESMACETPVVASDIGGIGATMRGFPEQLVPPGDPVRLAEAIKNYVTWRRTDPDLGPRSRAWVLEHMRFSRTIGAVDEVITEAAWSLHPSVGTRRDLGVGLRDATPGSYRMLR